jgi:hypothetical protein
VEADETLARWRLMEATSMWSPILQIGDICMHSKNCIFTDKLTGKISVAGGEESV